MKYKTTKKIIASIPAGIFPTHILLIVNMNFKELKQKLLNNNDEHWFNPIQFDKKNINNSNCALLRPYFNHNGTNINYFYIVLNNINYNSTGTISQDDYIAISHEIVHICQFLLPIYLDRNKEHEAEAYLHSYIFNNILSLL
jgi:hypothetical protein